MSLFCSKQFEFGFCHSQTKEFWLLLLLLFSCYVMSNSATPWTSVHGILQARILEWVAMPFSRESSQPRDRTRVSCIGGWILYHWATREALRNRNSTNICGKNKEWVLLDCELDCEPIACQALWLIRLPKFKSYWSSTGQTNQQPSLGPGLCLQPPEQTWLQSCTVAFLDCIAEFLGSAHFFMGLFLH